MSHINDESLTLGQNTYFIPTDDPTVNSAEFVRLGKQDYAVTESMDLKPRILNPEGKDIFDPTGKDILDVCCGTGGWIRKMVRVYPGIKRIVGFDNNKKIIADAQNHIATRNNKRVQYELMNLVELPWDFPDASFDYVNIRFISGVLSRDITTWRATFAECLRILKPGGVFRLTESEMSWMPYAPATNRMIFAMMQVMWEMGKAFANWQIAVTPILSKLLKESGLVNIQKQIIALDYSYGTELHAPVVEDSLYVMQVSRKGLIRFGGIPEEEFDALFEEMRKEVHSPNFLGTWPLVSWVARKTQE